MHVPATLYTHTTLQPPQPPHTTYLPYWVKSHRVGLAGVLVTVGRVKGQLAPDLQVVLGGVGRVSDVPGGTKDVEGLGENIVIDDAGVDREEAHQQ